MKSPDHILMLSAIAYHDAEICHGLCGKKEPSTTTEHHVVVRHCLTRSDTTFQRTCLLHHISKVLKFGLGLDACRVVRLKLDQMQLALFASTHVLAAGMKSCGEGHISETLMQSTE
jgi:hypothetical protein